MWTSPSRRPICCAGAAVALPDLAAGVSFYGRQPRAEDVGRIRAPLLIHYAGLDERINAGWPAYEAALRDMINEIVRDELQGELGERINRNLRKLIRREIGEIIDEASRRE